MLLHEISHSALWKALAPTPEKSDPGLGEAHDLEKIGGR